jgi:hypothetical protein
VNLLYNYYGGRINMIHHGKLALPPAEKQSPRGLHEKKQQKTIYCVREKRLEIIDRCIALMSLSI